MMLTVFLCSYWSAMQVNDELLQRLTSGKNLSPRLTIHRSTDTSAPLDYSSPPAEVENWLQKKGFSEPWVRNQSTINNNNQPVTPGKKNRPHFHLVGFYIKTIVFCLCIYVALVFGYLCEQQTQYLSETSWLVKCDWLSIEQQKN